MFFDDVPAVAIDRAGGMKFIVVLLERGDEKKTVVRADYRCEFHAQIFRHSLWRKYHDSRCSGMHGGIDKFCRSCDCGGEAQVKMKCLGGGRIHVNAAERVIYLWDYSTGFGREPREELTVPLLQAAYPDYRILCQEPLK